MHKKVSIDGNSRTKILDAALEEFAVKGLAGARVDKIAQNAKINKAMIYYHFSSKEKLYEKVIEREITEVVHRLRLELKEESDPEKLFLAIANQYMRVVSEKLEVGFIVLREVMDGGERLRNVFSQIFKRYKVPRRLVEYIIKGQKEGRFRQMDPRHVMISFIGMNLFYLQTQRVANTVWEIDDEEKFLGERPDHVVDLFLHGLLAR